MSDDAATFKPGDLVVLKSGGPIMTVDYIGPRESYDCETKGRAAIGCVWFKYCSEYGWGDDSVHVSPAALRPATPAELDAMQRAGLNG